MRSEESVQLEREYLELLVDDIETLSDQIVEVATLIANRKANDALDQLLITQNSLTQMINLVKGRVKRVNDEAT